MTGAVVQARMGSTRLPGKVLLPLAHKPVLFHIVDRMRHAQRIDEIVVATTTEQTDDTIEVWCHENGVKCFRGSAQDVLARYNDVAEHFHLDVIVRITGDCPLSDSTVIDALAQAFQASPCDYMSNVTPGKRTFPRGLDCEIFTVDALREAHQHASEQYEREHVTPFIHENKAGVFRIGEMLIAKGTFANPQYRLTLDYPEDYELLQHVFNALYDSNGIDVKKVIEYLTVHPNIAAINSFRESEYPSSGIRK